MIQKLLEEIAFEIQNMSLDDKVSQLNNIKSFFHELSPFKSEPVDCVTWVKYQTVAANDYNPNSVAPPEMELLRHSIGHDGYTQPVVTWDNGGEREVVDGFHRTRVCKEYEDVKSRVSGYLPVVSINTENTSKKDRMASTIRHNRARGKHNVTAMSDIVIELKNRNWKDERISRELGMDKDEVLRLLQITGLETMFQDDDFSKSWESGEFDDDFENLTDEFEETEETQCKTANTSDDNRFFHTWDKWECYKHGFYGTTKKGMTKTECEEKYREFLSSNSEFEQSLKVVINEWKYSCEHYLTNSAMNRIAWLGQASLAHAHGIPSKFCGGFNLLSEEQQNAANQLALKYLNIWLERNGLHPVSMDEALSAGRQIAIY